MGKSSLMVRTAARLRAQAVAVVVLDLTMVGQNLTVEQWYDGLLSLMGPQLGLEEELERFWLANQRLGPLQRWMAALAQVVLPKVCAGQSPRPLVIFIDEIDTVRSLPFSSDEFFAAIRACYNRRTEDPAFARLTFCLLGVATPSDLIRDTRMTPFNIGRRIELSDFNAPEAAPLAQGLAQNPQIAERLLQRVLYWTNGHPYLTQRLCRAVAERGTATSPTDVDGLCAELFLSVHARERDDNLIFVRERLLNSEVDRATLLDLYAKIRRGQRVVADETNPLVSVTRLSGIARSAEGCLLVRNRIYRDVFNDDWILSNMPDPELRRQRAAFRRGVIGAVVGVVVLAGLLSVPFFKTKSRQVELTPLEGQVEFLRPRSPDGMSPPPLATEMPAQVGPLGATGDSPETAVSPVPPRPSAVRLTAPATSATPVSTKAVTTNADRAFLNVRSGGGGSPRVAPSWAPLDPTVIAPVRLTGITCLASKKRALFEIVPAPGQPPITCTLEEGDRAESIEVIAIDVEHNKVTIKHNGALTNLTLASSLAEAVPADAGVISSIQGRVEIRRLGADAWARAITNQILRGGDMLRTGHGGRALIRLADQSTVKIAELSQVRLSSGPHRQSCWDLIKGALYLSDRGKPAADDQTIEKEILDADFNQRMQEWQREGWIVLSFSGPIRHEDGTIHRKVTLKKGKRFDLKTTNATGVIRG
jgi:hypothetical protein